MTHRENYWTRRSSRREVFGLAGGLAAAVLVGACGDDDSAPAAGGGTPAQTSAAGGSPAAQQPKTGGTLNIRLQINPPSMDPHRTLNISKYWILYNLYSNLVRYKMGPDVGWASAEIESDLAASWEQPDASTFIFKLRPGVKFHDGTEMTAEDVKFSLIRMATPHPTHEKIFLWDSIDTAGIQVLDKTTIRVPLKQPYFAFLYGLGWQPEGGIVSKPFVEKNNDDISKVVNGTGAFKLESFQDNVNYIMVKNPEYFRKGQPYLDKINNFVINDVNTVLAQFRAKQLDFEATLNKTQADALKASEKDMQFASGQQGSNSCLMLLADRPPFNDIRLRQAISLALDRPKLVSLLTLGEGVPCGPIGPQLTEWATQDPLSLPNMKRDLTKAKQLIAATGLKDLKFLINVTNQQPSWADWAQVVKQQLAEIDVTLDIQIIEHAIWFKKAIDRDFQMFQWARLPDFDPEGYIYPYYTKGGGRNFGNIDDPEMDALARKQRAATTKEDRKSLIQEFERKATEKAYNIHTHDGPRYAAWWPHVKNYRPHASYEDRRADAIWKDA